VVRRAGAPVTTMRWISALAIVTLLVGGSGCSPEEPPAEKPPESINLLILGADRILGPIESRILNFTRKTGIVVVPKPVPDPPGLSAIFATSQSRNHGIDVVVALNIWVADFNNSGFIVPLDDYIEKDRAANDPELDWKSIPKGIQDKNFWGGHIYSMICDNDNMFLIYRTSFSRNSIIRCPIRRPPSTSWWTWPPSSTARTGTTTAASRTAS
jgi:ABC-type glycerol-3-phosphate transport system substrate-binding protein